VAGSSPVSGGATFRTTAVTTITSVSTDAVDEALFADQAPPGYKDAAVPGTAPAAQPCDCSCGGLKAFQDLSQKQKDPAAKAEMQAKAPCGLQCMKQWISCAMPR
jgi:hypothetical protein